MTSPEISIVMPVFNAERFLEETIKSLLSQTFKDFELIIVNDGSTDSSLEIAKSFDDNRIRILVNDQNRGIVYSRNRGCRIMRGRYYAPFDADDIAHPEKFAKQHAFLEQNPQIALTGCRVKKINEEGKPTGKPWRLSAKPEQIPAIMLFRNYFVHSSLLLRREAIPQDFYKIGYDVVEDYMMCAEIAFKHPVTIFPEYLLKYRISPQSAMHSNDERLSTYFEKIYRYLFQRLGIDLSDDELSLLLTLKGQQRILNLQTLGLLEELLLKMIEINKIKRLVNQHQLELTITNRWLKAGWLTKGNFFAIVKKVLASPLV